MTVEVLEDGSLIVALQVMLVGEDTGAQYGNYGGTRKRVMSRHGK